MQLQDIKHRLYTRKRASLKHHVESSVIKISESEQELKLICVMQ